MFLSRASWSVSWDVFWQVFVKSFMTPLLPLFPQSTAAVVRTIWFFGGSPGFGQEVSALTLTAESQTWYRKYAPNVVKAYSAQGGCAFCRRPLVSRCGYRQPVINSIFCSLMVWFGELLPRGFDIAWLLAVLWPCTAICGNNILWYEYINIIILFID